MSNKKRISKKIELIDAKRMKALKSDEELMNSIINKVFEGYKALDQSMNNFIDWCKHYFPAHVLNDSEDNPKVFGVTFSQNHVEGYSFEENFDTEFIDFVYEIRMLTPLDELSCTNLCRNIPPERRCDFKNLLIVGFEANEAFDLLNETYKF